MTSPFRVVGVLSGARDGESPWLLTTTLSARTSRVLGAAVTERKLSTETQSSLKHRLKLTFKIGESALTEA